MGISPPSLLHSTTCRPSSPSPLSPRLLQPPSTPPSLSATQTPTWPSPPPTHTSTQSLTTTPRLTSSSLSLTMVTVVQGSYSVNLPDGRIQTVTYHANDYDGNI